jgi:hypothetical protein
LLFTACDPPGRPQRAAPQPLEPRRSQGEATRRDLVARIRGAVSEAQRSGNSALQLLDLEGAFDWWVGSLTAV